MGFRSGPTPARGRAPRANSVERLLQRRVRGDAPLAWQVITDHGLYGRLAINLSRVHPTAGDGPDLQRTCVNRKGQEWHESCTLWEDRQPLRGRGRHVELPLPAGLDASSWSVKPDGPGHVTLGMDFRFQHHRGVWGRTFAAAMHGAFPFVLSHVLRGWSADIAQRRAVKLSP
jgi:Polyketide cyclase / dehydrase and lipid transport